MVVVVARTEKEEADHVYADRVSVAVHGDEQRATLLCPRGMRQGKVMEIKVENESYFVTIPGGVLPGAQFQATIPWEAAAIVSDNHGEWRAIRYDNVQGAEKAWSALSPLFASVLFARRTRNGSFVDLKRYGLPSAVENIKSKFDSEFSAQLFP